MTHKDYIKIAKVLKKNYWSTGGGYYIWTDIVIDTASMLAEDDKSFNIQKFYDACGYVQE